MLLSVSRWQNASRNGSRLAAFSKRPLLCSRWQCHGVARASISFAPVPDTITEAINRAACGVIWHSTGQKPRDECHRTDAPRGTPLVIHERTPAMHTRERVRESETRATSPPPRDQRHGDGPERVFNPPSPRTSFVRVSRLAACPKSWKWNEGLGVNDVGVSVRINDRAFTSCLKSPFIRMARLRDELPHF